MPSNHVNDTDADDPVQWHAPVFVVSAGRSGSTHLTNTLNSHPELAITHESNIAHYISLTHALSYQPLFTVREVAGFRMTGLIPEQYAKNFAGPLLDGMMAAWRQLYRTEFAHKKFTLWGDKFQFPEVVPDLIRQFPEARFLYIVRDGRDVARSTVLHRERRGTAAKGDGAAMTFPDICRYWKNINQHLLEMLQGTTRVLRIRYEDLVQKQEQTITDVLHFLDLQVDPNIFRELESKAKERFQSHGTSKDPAASIGRWRTELSDEEKQIAHTIQGELLSHFGY
tara:strand:- start:1659 stop:2507 length:849 start_codon:yes stop_codon:yes gene_type:complete